LIINRLPIFWVQSEKELRKEKRCKKIGTIIIDVN
jgi:hypothetical protein